MSPTPVLATSLSLALIAALAADAPGQRRRFGTKEEKPEAAEAAAESGEESADPWRDAIAKACTGRLYGLRLSAARRIASGGDEAVPALRAWAAEHGRNTLPMVLVDAIGQADSDGAGVLALLRDWADDESFYWRSRALAGLAGRALEEDRERFLAGIGDPSYLMRVAGAEGLLGLDGPGDRERVHALLEDDDPRARAAVATALLGLGDTRGVPELIGALGDERAFAGDPWGPRRAARAFAALRAWAEDDFGYRPGAGAGDNREAIAAFARHARAEGLEVEVPDAPTAGADFAGSLEIRSCRYGDLFVRWDGEGRLVTGLEGDGGAALPPERWEGLASGLAGLEGTATHGNVVCDFLRLHARGGNAHHKVAPGALPAALEAWLEEVIQALRNADEKDLAAALELRLGQFASDG